MTEVNSEGETVWIASIYEQNISNYDALQTACRRILNELNNDEQALVLTDMKHLRQVRQANKCYSRLNFVQVRSKLINPRGLAFDALKRKTTISEKL